MSFSSFLSYISGINCFLTHVSPRTTEYNPMNLSRNCLALLNQIKWDTLRLWLILIQSLLSLQYQRECNLGAHKEEYHVEMQAQTKWCMYKLQGVRNSLQPPEAMREIWNRCLFRAFHCNQQFFQIRLKGTTIIQLPAPKTEGSL